MKLFLKSLFLLIFSSSIFLQAFALDTQSNLKLDSMTENSVSLSWDKIEGAIMYYVYYDKVSGIDNGYTMLSNYTENTNITVGNLDKGEKYYFSVVSLDENADESDFSNELMVDLSSYNSGKIDSGDFALEGVEVLAYNKIELKFSESLDSSEDAQREFKISSKNNPLDLYEVVETMINEDDNTKVQLTLDRELNIGTEYEVVILALFSANGNNIEAGVDNIENFMVKEVVQEMVPENTDTIEPENTDLDAAQEISGPNGTNLDSNEIENSTLVLAENSDNLPKTGAEHVLILALAIILSGVMFAFKFKRG